MLGFLNGPTQPGASRPGESGATGAADGTGRGAWVVAAIAVFAIAIRVLLWSRTTVLGTDAMYYLDLAEALRDGTPLAAAKWWLHPLFPWVTVRLGALGLPLETAAVSISILASGLTVVALCAFLRPTFAAGTAWIAGIFLAVHPDHAVLTSDAMSEGTYAMFLVAGLACLRVFWTSRRARWLALAGAATGLAYLVRPEGLILLPFLIVVPWIAARRAGRGWRVALAPIALGLATTAVFAMPYVWFVHSVSGRWLPTLKDGYMAMAQVGRESLPIDEELTRASRSVPPEPVPSGFGRRRGTAGSVPESASESAPAPPGTTRLSRRLQEGADRWDRGAALLLLLYTGWKTVYPPFVVLAFLGLFHRWLRRELGFSDHATLALSVGWMGLLCVLALRGRVVDSRWFVPILIPVLAWSAEGVRAVCILLRGHPRGSQGWVPVGILVALVVVPLVGKLSRPRRQDEAAVRVAGEWLRRVHGDGRLVLVGNEKVAYYADAECPPLTRWRRKELRESAVEYAAFFWDELHHLPVEARSGVPGVAFRYVRDFVAPDSGRRLLLYRVEPERRDSVEGPREARRHPGANEPERASG